VDVVVALAVPQMADTPAIPVSSNAVIARTESFLRFMIVVFTRFRCVLEYMECYTQQYFSRLDVVEFGNFRKTRYSNPGMSQNDTLEHAEYHARL